MKKIIFLGCLLTCSFFSKANIIITKKDGGLFGNKSVSETQAEGMHTLTCTDPGRTRCKATLGLVVITVGTQQLDEFILTSDELDVIDLTIENLVANERRESGHFIFDNKCFVNYTYDTENDCLIYNVYSIQEAQSLNLI